MSWLVVLALGWPALADEMTESHEKTLSAAGVKTDAAALAGFFRGRTLTAAEQARLEGLVRQLGADTFREREQASKDLIEAGRKAVPFLRDGLKSRDREVVSRARRCLTVIDPRPDSEVVLAAASLLAPRKVPKADEILLAFLPFLEEESALDELLRVLEPLAAPAGKPGPAIVAAARSRSARQRSAAAHVLGRSSRAADRNLAEPLLRDEDAGVRYRAAEALVLGKDPRGVKGLIELIGKGPPDLASQAEGLLAILAADKTPAVVLSEDDEQRKKCHAAWLRWAEDAAGKYDFSRVTGGRAFLGLRVAVAYSGYGGGGAVWEFGSDHKQRWLIRDVGGGFDAVVLPGNKVLVAEYNARRVTERDRSGKIHWEYKPNNGPLEVQRLANGNTLVATNYEIVEVTRALKVTTLHKDPGGNIFSAQRLPNGNVLFGLYSGWLMEIDKAGKEVFRARIEPPQGLANVVALPGNRYLLPLAGSNRLAEFDRAGKVVREVKVTSPTTVALLPGGGYLVGSHITNSLREVDRKGKVTWEQKAEGQIFRVRTR